MSGKKIEDKNLELLIAQGEHEAIELEMLKANKRADKSGKDIDREEATKQTNLLLASNGKIARLNNELDEARREHEATRGGSDEEPGKGEDSEGWKYVIGGFAVALLLLITIGVVVGF